MNMGDVLMVLTVGVEVEAREVIGQRRFCSSDQLPADMHGDRAIFEAMGIRFGEVLPDDPLFIQAELPAGWRKVATSHSMHSDVVDARGRKRVHIFYKAAFYDRKATMSPTARFSYSAYEEPNSAPQIGRVRDADSAVVFASTPQPDSTGGRQACEAECEAWLAEHWPDWRNPLAYWDEPTKSEGAAT